MMRRARAARFVTDFDSSVNMVRALGRFLKGKDHRGMSIGPANKPLAKMLASPPRTARRLAFIGMGAMQGLPLDRVRLVDAEEIAHWVTSQYGKGPFDTVVLGSASGGGLHLAAALGAPFLPQTTLVSVMDVATHPDDPVGAMEALAPTARLLARNNPDISVYHMHDPAQDRPMVQAMAYMRLKRHRLGETYRTFLEQRLAPGGTIIQFECERTWRVHPVGERAYFQFGCLGGIPEDEYHEGSERIAEYLEAEGSDARRWSPPEMPERRPEAEWGWDPAMAAEVAEVARSVGADVRRLTFGEPQELSGFVADLHRWWYGELGRPTDRLLAECYVQWDPLWVLRTGMVPFWNRFNMEPSFAEMQAYLEQTRPRYAHIYLNLFSQGLSSPGLVPVDTWRQMIEGYATDHAEIIGVDEDAYPVDTGSTVRYQPAFASLPFREELPDPLTVGDLDRFVTSREIDSRVFWTTGQAAPQRQLTSL
jgi:hypothetical protein